MASGGARSRSGPPPDLNSYRQRRNADGWVKLPAEVPRRRSPNWPIKPAPTDRERELWRTHWRLGQSIMWEDKGRHLQVALYVRLFAAVEGAAENVPASKYSQLRIMGEDLGLTGSGMARNKWRFETPDEAQERAEKTETAPQQMQQSSTAAQIARLFQDGLGDEKA